MRSRRANPRGMQGYGAVARAGRTRGRHSQILVASAASPGPHGRAVRRSTGRWRTSDGTEVRPAAASRSAGSGRGRRRASTTPSPTQPRRRYVDCHPPPNVTGALHTGHALNLSVGDLLDPLEADAGLQHALPARLRPRRHLDAERRRAGADRGGHVAPGARPRGVRASASGTGCTSTAARSSTTSGASARRSTTAATRFTMDDAYIARGDAASSCTSTAAAGSTARTGSSTGARTTRRRSPTSSSSTRTSTTRSRRSATRSRTATASSRSRPFGRRRFPPTSRSPCIRKTSATSI